jgi:hypothetical protein
VRTTEKLQFTEYTLEAKYTDRKGQVRDWHDASGYNNPTGTYNHMSAVRSQMNRMHNYRTRHFTDVEFRILSREVTRTEWKVTDGV